MASYTRLTGIDNELATSYENICWRLKEKSFTRNRKMNFQTLVKSILFKKGQTLSLELDEFTDKMGTKKLTKQAYSKQRQNLNPDIFRHLNNCYVNKIYDEIPIEMFKDFIVLSVDGSGIELPNSIELKQFFGVTEGQKGSVGRVRAKALGIYDSLNRIMIKTTIDPYNKSEKDQFIDLLDELIEFMGDKKFLIVFDRYYFGLAFINKLNEKGIKYLIRQKLKDYKKEKEQMKTNDEIVKLKVRNNSIFYAKEENKEKLKEKKFIETRIIKIKLPNGADEHLCTNLIEEELSIKEAGELYFSRWNIEKSFDIIKNKINIENFSSKTIIGVKQDFYAQMMVYNMIEDLKRDVEEEMIKNPELKYDYKLNMNILAGIFKKKFVDVLMAPNKEECSRRYMKMIDEIRKHVVPIKPGRSFERKRMHSMNKYRNNLRRNV